MRKTLDLFPDLVEPRARRRHLMHVCDAGGDGPGSQIVRFSCAKCGHESEWMQGLMVTEAKRGIECPRCNKCP